MFGFFICLSIILYVIAIGVMMFFLDPFTDSFILQWIGSLFWPITVWIVSLIIIIKYLRNERSNL